MLDREWIERSGVTTVAEILRLIPQQPFLRPDGFRSNGAQYAELRGLGVDTTLVLINGRRAFASAASFTVNAFDLNQVPLSAVERVEVQLDSISVRHGADAIGGVVNIVLRDDIRSPSVEARYGAAAGGGEQSQASFSAGYQSDNVNAAVILDYRSVIRCSAQSATFGAIRTIGASVALDSALHRSAVRATSSHCPVRYCPSVRPLQRYRSIRAGRSRKSASSARSSSTARACCNTPDRRRRPSRERGRERAG